ncbi:anhydro-N-acetylmuramic acid kinase [Sphingobacterium corticibacter]|uniref:Anhydro-N-acetylmuramic acid kinase n=1 Tax=Sphingobacterium corticibacter TaxID=2171749 RepID=A0A2T8HJL8_9SPHI|nr:anhydro-N-acetylmuramic acid kinase [Sphingobacterium corticibacter]PVH25648.1 anhydro-N-acetylmuramic acid kinase [Sphingobacterium corticibacter]
MNTQIEKLYQIAQKKERLIIGLMSGTSLDGLDIALCQISGSGTNTQLRLLNFATASYSADFRNEVKQIFAQQQVDHLLWSTLHVKVAQVHADLVLSSLSSWGLKHEDIDLIASHGQTVFHAPKGSHSHQLNSTLQIGDGDHIAVKTGIITISDFRQKHVAAGGDGAPLVVYGDALLYTSEEEYRILLNIGGISNFTFLPKQSSGLSAYATDLGPGNTLMNQYMQKYLDEEMDCDGALARRGVVHDELLKVLLETPFLTQDFPKTTGPELFNLSLLDQAMQQVTVTDLDHADILATLAQFTIDSVVDGIRLAVNELDAVSVYVSGGGLHNPHLMQGIQQGLTDCRVSSFDAIGFDPDAKEAALFAVLANETIAGAPEHVAHIAGSPAVCMGKISFPY